jgi:hypothetical protein
MPALGRWRVVSYKVDQENADHPVAPSRQLSDTYLEPFVMY